MNLFQLLRWHTPVRILPATDNAVLTVLLYNMLHPLFDEWITALNSLTIAILAPQHIARERQCCRPRHIVAIVVPEGWRHIGDATVRPLCLTDVTHPFGIESFIVEQKTLAQRPHGAIAQPGLALIALRTVDGHTLVIVQDTPPGVLHHLVQYRIRTLKMSRRLHLVSYHFSYEVVLLGML